MIRSPESAISRRRRTRAGIASLVFALGVALAACADDTVTAADDAAPADATASTDPTTDTGATDGAPAAGTDAGTGDSAATEDTADSDDDIAAGTDDEGGARVARHIDGDSLELDIDGEIVEVRLVGINAPEMADCQGPAARDALAALLDDRPIEVVGSEEDRFGRLLVDLEVDGEAVDEAMVRQGWALAIQGEGDHLVGAMVTAAEQQLGWWAGAVEGCAPVDGDIVVVDAEPDPRGRDEENLNGEYVVLANAGDGRVDLEGWALRDESTGNRFVFDAVTLGPGDELIVFTGCGQDRADEVYWCSEYPVWSNQGETVMLLGPGGTYVDHLFLAGS